MNASLWIQTLLGEKVKIYSFSAHFLKAPILSGTNQVIGKPVANRIEVYDHKKFTTHKPRKSVKTGSAILLNLTEKNRQTTWGHRHRNIWLVLCYFSWCIFVAFSSAWCLHCFIFFETKANCTFWMAFNICWFQCLRLLSAEIAGASYHDQLHPYIHSTPALPKHQT